MRPFNELVCIALHCIALHCIAIAERFDVFVALSYLEEVEMLEDVDSEDDVDTELEVDTLKRGGEVFSYAIVMES